ncbi:hypothetical protein GCM10027073_50710 [Streptomyces chlorus]
MDVEATARARTLRNSIDTGQGYKGNLWTDVDLLVEKLMDQARRARG